MYKKHAFTLLEVVLTLSMAVVLMTLVGATLQFYATNMNVRDTDVRRVHLASSILQMVTDDLRASLYGSTFDASTLETFLAASGQSQTETAGAELDPAAAETLGTASADDTAEDASATESPDLVASTMTLIKPGLIGNQNQIQFDISRLPRLENWTQAIASQSGVLTDVPSDTKTVTYYVQPPGTIAGVLDPIQGYLPTAQSGGATVTSGGLVRRELDRAASKWAIEAGGLTGLMMTGDLIATEVLAIEFGYFDGTVWQIAWNSDSQEAMPKAIRVKVTISDETATYDVDSLAIGLTPGSRTFTHIVQLPVGMSQASSSESETTETGTAATDGTAGAAGSATGAAGGAGTTGTGTSP